MRSRLFRALFEDPASDNAKTFQRHLRELLALSDAGRLKCIEALPTVLSPTTDFQTRSLCEKLAGDTSTDPQTIEHSLSVLAFFVKALLSDAVPPDDHVHWIDDLNNLDGLTQAERTAFGSTIKTLADQRDTWRVQDRQGLATSGVTPRFKSMGVTVEARAVRRDKYRWGTPIEHYEPQILGVAYVASVAIGFSEGMPDEVYFQMDESDIDNMIGSLLAAKKELQALRHYIANSKDKTQ